MKKIGLFMLLIAFVACKSKNNPSNLTELTQRIQYEVNIKSPDVSYDWWIQNIEGSKREGFVKSLIKAAYDGDIEVYDVFGKKLTPSEVKKIENSVDSAYIASQIPPYEDSLIVTKSELNPNAITRLSFIEEWKFGKENMNIEKRIIGYAPLIEKYDREGDFRGYKPLFWVYFDEKYPNELKGVSTD